MAFESEVVVMTQPGSTGNQTYNLSRVTDPKAVIVWGTRQAADGSAADSAFWMGFGTYRGAAVQQAFTTFEGNDAAGTAAISRQAGTDALFKVYNQTAGAGVRGEVDLVSMAGGGSPQVVINWVALSDVASMRVFMLVLGGSDITDALVKNLVIASGSLTQDETVDTGFGKPELVFMFGHGSLAGGSGNPPFSFGFGKEGEAGRAFGYSQENANTASITAARQRSDRIMVMTSAGASDTKLGQLDTTVSNWPTDGFRLVFDATTSSTNVSYLAIRTTAQITTGANTAPTAGGLPVVQDNNAGFVPKLGFLLGWNLAAASTLVTSGTDLGGWGVGAYDGTQEAWAGFTEDDAAGTMDSNMQQSSAKVIRNYSQAAALQSEADGAFSGNNFRLSWNDIDTVAREYQWLVLGDSATPPTASLIYNPPRQASNLYNR